MDSHKILYAEKYKDEDEKKPRKEAKLRLNQVFKNLPKEKAKKI
jgi:hypothetical protein